MSTYPTVIRSESNLLVIIVIPLKEIKLELFEI